MLLFLTLVLVGPYLVLTAVGHWYPRARMRSTTRAKVGLSLLFVVTSSGHFVSNAAMSEMLPPFVPLRRELIYMTGVLELLGAIGVWVPRVQRIAGLCMIVMLIGILPANIYSAFARVEYGGHGYGPAYLLVRIPFQLVVIAWTYWATEQRWMRSKSLMQGRHPADPVAPPRVPTGVA
jgi:uncharacterized membrane protein